MRDFELAAPLAWGGIVLEFDILIHLVGGCQGNATLPLHVGDWDIGRAKGWFISG